MQKPTSALGSNKRPDEITRYAETDRLCDLCHAPQRQHPAVYPAQVHRNRG
nr:hypothetical protein [Sulfitobacter brevis]